MKPHPCCPKDITMTTPNTSASNELFPIEIFKKQLTASPTIERSNLPTCERTTIHCQLSTANSLLSNCSRLKYLKNNSPRRQPSNVRTCQPANVPPPTVNSLDYQLSTA
jgi:hypothetical protein